jgi:hypothetical protein
VDEIAMLAARGVKLMELTFHARPRNPLQSV